MKRPILLLASAVLVLGFTSACGGGDDGGGGRPSVDEVADGVQGSMADELGGDVPDGAVDCIAQAFYDSDISDEGLQAIADGDEDYEASDEDQEALQSIVTDDMTKCMTDAAK
ncbi:MULTISPECIES: hypothetical protein [unclassified Nocardioides]|uniref:hypothetical protein n=1 Tax=unclassified Nocardioides TaxID=2615069 RepID=UPI000A2709B8|nr:MULTISPECIES: hypothetical protein [unclassified Nocardioides]